MIEVLETIETLRAIKRMLDKGDYDTANIIVSMAITFRVAQVNEFERTQIEHQSKTS